MFLYCLIELNNINKSIIIFFLFFFFYFFWETRDSFNASRSHEIPTRNKFFEWIEANCIKKFFFLFFSFRILCDERILREMFFSELSFLAYFSIFPYEWDFWFVIIFFLFYVFIFVYIFQIFFFWFFFEYFFLIFYLF